MPNARKEAASFAAIRGNNAQLLRGDIRKIHHTSDTGPVQWDGQPVTAHYEMKSASAKGTAIATLIASLVGTGAWLLGWSRMIWLGHPMIATFIITVVMYI
ncbi:MAG: hypothetical protein ABSB86_06625, partial [Bryobacteraceae bacterium]